MKSIGYIIATCIIVIGLITICIADYNKKQNIDRHLYEYVVTTNTIEACEQYLEKYKDEGNYKREVQKQLEDIIWKEANTTRIYDNYLKKYPRGKYSDEAKEKIEKQKEREEALKWNTETKAWKEATSQNTSTAYKKYLKLYPYGANVQRARKLVIDKEVDEIFGSEHGKLPSMDKFSYGYGNSSLISIYNSTNYILTIRYSGSVSKQIEIAANSSRNFSLPNGNYRIAASVNTSNVRNYAGTENLTGGSYNAVYHIQTSNW
jgi:hypothetical protein